MFFLIGNKADLIAEREVAYSEAACWALGRMCGSFEISSTRSEDVLSVRAPLLRRRGNLSNRELRCSEK